MHREHAMSATAMVLYEELATTMERMAVAAREALWEDVQAAQQRCEDLVRRVRTLPVPALDAAQKSRKESLLRAMLAHDAQVRHFLQPEMARLEVLLATGQRTREASAAYSKVSHG
jgi:hypothetical protein